MEEKASAARPEQDHHKRGDRLRALQPTDLLHPCPLFFKALEI